MILLVITRSAAALLNGERDVCCVIKERIGFAKSEYWE